MRKEIDLKADKSEAELQQIVDRIAINGTRQWFEWLGWALIYGAFLFLFKETGHVAVQVILGITAALFILHFASFFYQWELKNIPYIKNEKIARFVSFLLSGMLGMGLHWLLTTVIILLREKGA